MNDILVCGSTSGLSHNIIIEAEAGSGKTVLCDRIAYLWANQRQDVKGLDQYYIVILIKVHLIKLTFHTVYDYIKSELLPDSDEDCLKCLFKEYRVLFIVNGYDELYGNAKLIHNLINKGICPNSTTILTTRFGHRPELKYFNQFFTISRLAQTDVDHFISKYSQIDPSFTNERLNISTHALGSMLGTPLFLWFYVILGAEFSQSFCSRTELFAGIVSGIIERGGKRIRVSNEECEIAMNTIMEEAHMCMCNDSIYVDKKLTKVEENLGFLRKVIKRYRFSTLTRYCFTHKSVVEYLTAMYISKQDPDNIVTMLQKIPEVQNIKRRLTSSILMYLCGRLSSLDGLHVVFQQFVPSVDVFTSNYNHIIFLLTKLAPLITKLDSHYSSASGDNANLQMYTKYAQYTIDIIRKDIATASQNDKLLNVLQAINKNIQSMDKSFSHINDPTNEKYDYDDHLGNHFGLLCLAELQHLTELREIWKHCVSDTIVLNASRCTHYYSIGLKRLLDISSKYELGKLTVMISSSSCVNALGPPNLVSKLCQRARNNGLLVVDNLTPHLWDTVSRYYQTSCVDFSDIN